MDEGTRRCCQHRACVDRDLHELYAMSKKSKRPVEKDSTTVAAPIGTGPMSPVVVRVDEAVGVDDGDTGDGLVLDEDEGRWTGDGVGYRGSSGGGRRRAEAAAKLAARRRCSK